MTIQKKWKPSLKWHLTCLGVLLVLCSLIFAVICFLKRDLPAPYQPHRPAYGTTPWNN